jgi:regulator of cell morphogenesis and NO signaling
MLESGAHQPIGHLAASRPVSIRVFLRHDIDIGWEGGEPLARVCERRGLDPLLVLREIAAEEACAGAVCVRWEARPLPELIDHIVRSYHRPLRGALPEMERLAERVSHLHRGRESERLAEVLATLGALRLEVEPHMAKEEVVLFPWLRTGRGALAGELLGEAAGEHAVVGECLARLRELTDHYRVPLHASPAWNELWIALQLLEVDLREHIHLENDILFPRAMAS